MTKDIRYTPSSTHIYGLYDPEYNGITFYKTSAERDKAAEETIQAYLSEGEWYEGVTSIFAFTVTHRATQIDVVSPVGEIDEDGCDEAGEDWSNTNCDYKCNYALKPFPKDTADDEAPMTTTVRERNPECLDVWPDCVEWEYDPRCCRFPKSCSCDLRPRQRPTHPTPEATNA